jgi:capsular exopolysaccharide synthesis family protein
MGKITSALKKIEQQREIQKQSWKEKQKEETNLDEQKVTSAQDKQRLQVQEEQAAIRKPTLEQRVKSLQERLKEKVYIAKATDDSGIDPRVVTYYNPNSHISEQYRMFRTNIHSKTSNRLMKTLLISSALRGEGKTVTAVNLAVALAQDFDKKVFLADCDLRGGNVHNMLNINLSPGLSDVLANGTASEAGFQNSKIKNLTVLTRGEIPANPSELLGSKRMRRLLEELRARFDYIILDTPPVISITDARILGPQTDGVMFVVQAQKTQERTVRHAQELLEQARAKTIGFVLTQVDHYVPGYYSYYYYYYKSNKGNKDTNPQGE